MKKLKRSFTGACLAAAFGILSTFSVMAQTNVAAGKTVTADSELNSTYVAEKAVDNNNSGNSSRWLSANTSWPHWIEVDLGSSYDINQLKFWTGYNGYKNPVEYEFQYWNGSSW